MRQTIKIWKKLETKKKLNYLMMKIKKKLMIVENLMLKSY